MTLEFATAAVSCSTEGCPNNGRVTNVPVQLDPHGCVPRIVCGVCSLDIVPDPHPIEEEPLA
jgi:hypothetical protein